jgi:hypothetical protein
MGKWKGVILIIVLQLFYLLGCASEEVREEPKPVEKEVSCTFNQLDGECRIFSSFLGEREKGNSYLICSGGTCSEGDCENGKGTLSFPAGGKIEGTFKKGKLNGAGSYVGCGSSYTGTFKDNLKEKGILITEEYKVKDFSLNRAPEPARAGGPSRQYYDGLFQNEMRNGKGIYYSSRDSKDNSDSNIYEGTWKDDVKNGAFVVYSNFRGDFPLSEKGAVLKTAYNGLERITYVNDRDKEVVNQEERDRKYKAIQEAKEREENENYAARQYQYEREQEREQNARQKKYEAERDRAFQACQATRSEYSPQCKDFNRRY